MFTGDCLVRADDPRKDLLCWEAYVESKNWTINLILTICRARSTSAAPIYFKPYFHNETRKTYVDGAMRRNNPVRVADEERQLIWRDEMSRPDIILSIGTGLQVKVGTGVAKIPGKKAMRERMKKLLPKGVRKNLATAYDVVQSTFSCEKEWEDFLQAHRSDDKFLRTCHRLNVSLTEKLPKIDGVNQIEELEREANAFLARKSSSNLYYHDDYKTAASHYRKVALRLLAALFYYDPLEPPDSNSPPSKSLAQSTGYIRCRLSPNMTAQFKSLLGDEPTFRIVDSYGKRDITELRFDMVTFSSSRIKVSMCDTSVIEVRFFRRTTTGEAISGFS